MPVIKSNVPQSRINRNCRTIEFDMSRAEIVGHSPPDGAGAALHRIPKLGIGSPITIVTFVEQIGEDTGEFRPRDPLGNPAYAHAFEWMRPDLLIVREHEMRGDAFAERTYDPIPEIVL